MTLDTPIRLAANYLECPAFLDAFSDWVEGELTGDDETVTAMRAYRLDTYSFSDDEDTFAKWLDSTPYMASQSNDQAELILFRNISPVQQLSSVVVEYRGRINERQIATWRVVIPRMAVYRGKKYRRTTTRPITSLEVASELVSLGGFRSLVHAVMGAHYFWVLKGKRPSDKHVDEPIPQGVEQL